MEAEFWDGDELCVFIQSSIFSYTSHLLYRLCWAQSGCGLVLKFLRISLCTERWVPVEFLKLRWTFASQFLCEDGEKIHCFLQLVYYLLSLCDFWAREISKARMFMLWNPLIALFCYNLFVQKGQCRLWPRCLCPQVAKSWVTAPRQVAVCVC